MQPDKMGLVREWLAMAREDLLAADRTLHGSPALLNTALFHCQQAAEKALKGYLAWHDQPFRRTHDLRALISLCLAIDAAFTALAETARTLTPYAVEVRYPRDVPRPTSEEAEEALHLAHEVFTFVLDRLPPEVKA